jgi:deoxyribodipyrimidine photo-lyase
MNNAIIWLRRDLRIIDQITFYHATKQNFKLIPIFIFDSKILADFPNKLDKRLSFIADALVDLRKELKNYDGELYVFYGIATELIPLIAKALKVSKVFASEDYEPLTIIRDNKIKEVLQQLDIEFELNCDHLIFNPRQILKKDNTPYKVFTPYSRIWRQNLTPTHFADYSTNLTNKFAKLKNNNFGSLNLVTFNDATELLEKIGYKYQKLTQWDVTTASSRLDEFTNNKIDDYKINRNFLSIDGTSKLSPFLRFGIISIRKCVRDGFENHAWINELIWRDFYAMILYHFPHSAGENFSIKYQNNLNWLNDNALFELFCQGKTGFPVIDAAIKQMLSTGWMHNRARMIVASFLTKHLLIDWKLGEKFFAGHLLDYELSSNVGGWQWAASTGVDSVPYFRIFNPITQSKNFDPTGDYIKTYLPELSTVPIKYIHEPNKYQPNLYHQPIIDLSVARIRAIKFFKNI